MALEPHECPLCRLLIIEDEKDIAAFVANVARNCGYDVTVTHTMNEFVAFLTSWKPTHVVLDLHMPDTDGIELLRVLSSQRSTAQILIISGADSKVVAAAERIGLERGLCIAGTMLKPFRVADIRTQLERLKDGHGTITSASLLLAIKGNQLQLMYQPKIDMRSLALTGFEGLVRWQHPARGLLGPADFFHIADENVMDPLTKAVIAIGLEQLAAWQAAEIPGGLSLNISAHNLHEVDFADNLVQVCQRFGVAPGQLTLELTETAATEDTLKAMDILTRLRLKGFRLSIDDFGMGYSSLSQLHRLPFSEMKVDREFVSKCHTSRDARTIVRTIVRLAHELGMKAVAEGVENDEIMKILGDLDCDEAQGYHICRPLQPDQIPEFLETWRLKVGAAVPNPISVRRQLGR